MYARLVNELREAKEWLYEVKFDGYRCLAGRDSTGVTLWSRARKPFQKTVRSFIFPLFLPRAIDAHKDA
jgi:ATP-dependent DNA ligase